MECGNRNRRRKKKKKQLEGACSQGFDGMRCLDGCNGDVSGPSTSNLNVPTCVVLASDLLPASRPSGCKFDRPFSRE